MRRSRAARGDLDEGVRVNKRTLETLADLKLALYGNARTLAKLGGFRRPRLSSTVSMVPSLRGLSLPKPR